MSRGYRVERRIDAPPERVWGLLTDSASYESWNPTVLSIEGDIAEGDTIALVSEVSPRRTFKLKVSDVRSPTSMVWSDGMPLGLFRGTRTFLTEAADGGGTRFAMEELYTGPLAPLITKSIPDMTDSFERFADGLKTAAEAG